MGPKKGPEADQRAEAPLLWGQADRFGVIQHGEEREGSREIF